MKNFGTIFKREFAAYFNSPVAYIYIIVFLLITAGLYMSTFFLLGTASMRGYFSFLPLFLSVFIPCLTMRLWAEERKLGTLTLLLSFPMRSGILVLGKFAAAFVFYLVALAGSLTIPWVLTLVGNPDPGPILTGYLGAAFTGGMFLSVGIFISALFEDQIVAFILTILVCFGMCMLGVDFIAAFLDGWVGGLGHVLQKALGVTYHVASFQRGVVDVGDVLFFLTYTVILLVLNTFTLDSKIKLRSPRRFYAASLFLLAIAFVSNLLVSDLRLGRLDCTEGKIYTISPATRKILSSLKAPVDVNYYVSSKEKMPSPLKNLRQEVEDKLSDLARLSPRFRYHVYNPQADPSKIPELEKEGIVPFQARTIERDSVDIKRIYSAISITYLDKKTEVIPQVVPQTLGTLEYDLMSKIYRMTLEKPPRIAMVAPIEPVDPRYADPRMRELLMKLGQRPPQAEDHYRSAMQLLREAEYRVSRISLSKKEPLPKDTRTLVIFQPETLNDRQIYEIQRFLARGGNVVLAAQPYEFSYRPSREGLQVTPRRLPNNVNRLLDPYGVQLDSRILMDPEMAILNIQVPRRIGGIFNAMVSTPVKLPIQIRVSGRGLNPDSSVTQRIAGLLYLWGGALKLDSTVWKNHGWKAVTLAESSTGSWLMPFQDSPLTSRELRPGPDAKTGPRPLAVLLRGTFPDLYQGKTIPPWPETGAKKDASQKKPDTPEKAPGITAEPGCLVVIGCSKMFTNRVLGALDNRLFFQNLVDGLSLTEDLVGIRAKAHTVRYIEHVSAGKKLLYRFLAVVLVPLLLAAVGVGRFLRRRRRRERYEKSMATA